MWRGRKVRATCVFGPWGRGRELSRRGVRGAGEMKFSAASRGFSGMELTITLIVLGMIFLMTLKGAAGILAMRAWVLTHQIQGYQSAVMQYISDRTALPGDDVRAPGDGRQPSLFMLGGPPVSFAGDGKIDGDLDDPQSPLGEQYLAWQDLRRGEYVEGDPTLVGQSARPENMFGGVFGFAADQLGLNQVLCLTKIPGEVAASIDRKMDDGNVATGRLRGTSQWDPVDSHNHFTAPDTTPYDPSKTYIICLPYQP